VVDYGSALTRTSRSFSHDDALIRRVDASVVHVCVCREDYHLLRVGLFANGRELAKENIRDHSVEGQPIWV